MLTIPAVIYVCFVGTHRLKLQTAKQGHQHEPWRTFARGYHVAFKIQYVYDFTALCR